MSAIEAEDKLANAMAQARAQYDSIKEMVDDLDQDARDETIAELEAEIDEAYDEYVEAKKEIEEEALDRDDWMVIEVVEKSPIAEKQKELDRLQEIDEDAARERIQEDALSVQVRSGWYQPGADKPEPEEYEILLCTGGPAVRIVGELNDGQPTTATIECQDWFTPWTEWCGETYCGDEEVLLAYARCFYFGEG